MTLSKDSRTISKSKNSGHNTAKIIIIAIMVGLFSGFIGAFGFALINKLLPNTVISQSKQVVIDEQKAVTTAAKKVSPSVVSIVSSSVQIDPFSGSSLLQQTGAGTGIIVSSDGLILTNKHVISDGETFTVITSDNKEYKNAKVVAKDPGNDIAFIKVNAGNLTPAELGDSDTVEVGQSVIAIGNALGQFQNTVTTGVISGKSRPITASGGNGSAEKLTNLFQTDAAINPGNSGGPLVTIEGKVIGINTAVAGGSENIGFAIPINDAKASLESVKTKGKIVRAYIGVRYIPLDSTIAKQNDLPVENGALIYARGNQLAVLPSSPAASAGLREGDIIVKFNDQPINEKNPLSSYISKAKPGDTVTLTILRDNKQQQVKLTLGEAPSN